MLDHNDVWTLKKYLLYDFAQDQLADSRLFASYAEAAQAADGLATVMIVSLALERDQPPDGSELGKSRLTAQS